MTTWRFAAAITRRYSLGDRPRADPSLHASQGLGIHVKTRTAKKSGDIAQENTAKGNLDDSSAPWSDHARALPCLRPRRNVVDHLLVASKRRQHTDPPGLSNGRYYVGRDLGECFEEGA